MVEVVLELEVEVEASGDLLDCLACGCQLLLELLVVGLEGRHFLLQRHDGGLLGVLSGRGGHRGHDGAGPSL